MKQKLFIASVLLVAQSSFGQVLLAKRSTKQNKSSKADEFEIKKSSVREILKSIQIDKKTTQTDQVLKALDVKAMSLGQDRGGGDLCENRIQNIRDDIKSWIRNGGPQNGLRLESPVTSELYSKQMLDSINKTRIKCVKIGDVGYPVTINHTPKVCRFDRSPSDQLITCDYASFLNENSMSESAQYVLIHHEYAGLGGLENPEGDISTYKISNQITGFLEDQLIKKLAIKPLVPPVIGEPQSKFQKLQVMYESATELVKIQDLNQSENTQSCYLISSVHQDDSNGPYHFEMVEIKTSGNADPVFPVAPTSEWFAVMAGRYRNEGATIINDRALHRKLTPYPTYHERDLVVVQPRCAVTARTEDGEDCYRASKFLIRKNNKGLIFKKTSPEDNEVNFGYCFNKSGPKM